MFVVCSRELTEACSGKKPPQIEMTRKGGLRDIIADEFKTLWRTMFSRVVAATA
jgi:hypothetical protein